MCTGEEKGTGWWLADLNIGSKVADEEASIRSYQRVSHNCSPYFHNFLNNRRFGLGLTAWLAAQTTFRPGAGVLCLCGVEWGAERILKCARTSTLDARTLGHLHTRSMASEISCLNVSASHASKMHARADFNTNAGAHPRI